MLDRKKVREWLARTDGYGILSPDFFLDMGVDQKIVKRCTYAHSDDGEKLGKHAATRNDGKPGPVYGVDEFSMVEVIAATIGAESCSTWMGRGKNFRGTVSNILQKMNAAGE